MAAPAELTHANSSQPESATTLSTIVELVRRIMHADVAAILSFSMVDETITWKAASGYRAHVIDELHPIVQPVASGIARRALEEDTVAILEGVGVRDEFPAESFPVHVAEGVQCI